MTKSMNPEEKKARIINMLSKWNEIRWNHKKALELLSTGAYFAVTSANVEMWSNAPIKPKFIHSYFGVEDNKLFFVLIDSDTDKMPISKMENFQLDKIVIQEFSNNLDIFTPNFVAKSIDGNVTVKEALLRNLCWQLMKGSWVEEQINSVRDMQVGIARVFSSPFSDLEKIQAVNFGAGILAVMGLKALDLTEATDQKEAYERSPYQLDLCFWGLNKQNELKVLALRSDEIETPVEDLTRICPPHFDKSESFSLIFG